MRSRKMSFGFEAYYIPGESLDVNYVISIIFLKAS